MIAPSPGARLLRSSACQALGQSPCHVPPAVIWGTQYLLPFPGRAMRRLNRRRCGPGARTLMWAMSEGYRRGEGRSREIKMGSYGIRACRPPNRCLRSVVLPDCRGPVSTTTGNSLAARFRTGSRLRRIYAPGMVFLTLCNYAFRMHDCKQNPAGVAAPQRCSSARTGPAMWFGPQGTVVP